MFLYLGWSLGKWKRSKNSAGLLRKETFILFVMTYFVLAYYLFTTVENPEEEVASHKEFFKDKDIKGRIYISSQGINGQASAAEPDAYRYMEWLKSKPAFQNIEFKIHTYHDHAFPRATVKLKSQLVALDVPVDLNKTGEYLSPKQWREMLEKKDDNTLVIDVRNDYEWKVGHFVGSELPTLDQFRHFPKYAQELKQKYDLKNTKVMMCCTGGIRCELYSALLKQEGFEHVYQLHGGIIKYGLEEGTKAWKGKLFVFDDRLTVPISEKEDAEVISVCKDCGQTSDLYYNCANMDCNELFISCLSCAEKHQGCCCNACMEAPRVRPFQKEARPKPYRRKHLSSEIAQNS